MNKKTPLVLRFVNVCWTSFAIAVIFIAVLLSVARMLLPLVDEYRGEIESWLSVELDRQLKIGGITADWKGLYPKLVVSEVSLLSEDGKESWLDIEEIRVSVNVLSLLSVGQVETGVINIVGTSISLEHHDDGGYSMNGVRMGKGNLRSWLFSRKHISILDSEFILKDPRVGEGTFEFKDASILLENIGLHHQIRGLLSLPDQEGRNLSFVLDIFGDIQDEPETLNSKFYAEGDALFGPWLRKWGFRSLKFNAGEAKFHIWAGGSLKQLKWVEGDIGLHDIDWSILPKENVDKEQASGVSGGQGYKLSKVSGNFFWKAEPDGWSLDVEQFDFSREIAQAWPSSSFNLVYKQSPDDIPDWEGRFEFLRLQDLNALLLSNTALGSKVRGLVATLEPQGDLYDIAFRFNDQNDDQASRYFLKARFEDMAINKLDKVPEFSGFDGDLLINNEKGFLHLSSHEALVDFGALFRSPLIFDELSGNIYWNKTETGVLVESDHLATTNQDVNTEGRFTLLFPDEGGSPFLSLRGFFVDGDIEQAHHYLPVGIMRTGLVSWLDEALVGGRIKSGGVLVHGQLSDFPFDAGKGVFDIRFTVEDVILQYGETWPRAEELSAEIVFHGRSFRAEIGEAKIYEMDVLPTTVSIGDMTANSNLELELGVSGKTPDLLRFLKESPAGGDYRNILNKIESGGDSKMSLDLTLPIFDAERREFKGEVYLSNSDLFIQEWDARISDLQGKLNYSYGPSGYRFLSENMKSRFNGKEANIEVISVDGISGANEKHINVSTHMDIENLLGKKYTGLLSEIMVGEADWMLGLQVKPGSGDPHSAIFHLESDLLGVEISMPGDFRKSIDQVRPFSMNILLTDNGAGPVEIDYGQILSASLLFGDESGTSVFRKGAIHFGDEQAVLPEKDDLEISGYLPVILFSEWEEWLNTLPTDTQQSSIAERIGNFDISVDLFESSGFRLHKVKLNGSRQPASWDAVIQSQEVTGSVRLPLELNGDDPIVLDLEKLHIRVSEEEKQLNLDPGDFPALRLSSKSFHLGDTDFGKTSIVTRKIADGIMFEAIEMQSPLLDVMANGSWTMIDEQQFSRFNINAKSPDLGLVLKQWGYEGTVDGGTLDANLKANWEGRPTAFKLETLNGDIDLNIYNGQLLPVNAGAGKIFGLLSLQALPRRLTLDFSDLFKKGFGFDYIKGTFAIAEGEAYTNDLYMEGPAARIETSGRIGLVSRDYDQYVLVTPLVTSSIPVIGGLAGGPVVGLGLWLADRMFGSGINKLSRVQYTITGSWDDPVIDRIGDAEDDKAVEKKMKKRRPEAGSRTRK